MKEYICKIASVDEVIAKWNYEIKKQKRKQKKSALELVKNNAIENIKNGQAVIYYGKLNDKIICQATAMFDENIIQNSDGLVGVETVYLCNFSTDKKYQGRGFFSKLFKFVIEDLKNKGYIKYTLGVEPKETKNLQIYQHFGFNTLIKSEQLAYPDGTIIDVDYYEMKLD